MNPSDLLRIVDSLHREKNIAKEIVFLAIEAALVSASKRHYGEETAIEVKIDRASGQIAASIDGQPLDSEETVGRIGAQTAKQVIIQKIREAERDALYDEYNEQMYQLVSGVVTRNEGNAATVQIGANEALLPRSEQIPGESHHPNERLRAVICEVRKQGSRVKIILSRTRTQLVQRLFEQEIPEINESVILIKAIAREPGYRSKVAVYSSDQRVDCVGACVGVRGNRIKNITNELSNEKIDIVRWSDNPQELIPFALQPAEVDEVILCQMMGRAIVLVREDQLSLAIGRRGQNVRLASKLCGWDIEIMTREELEQQIERAVGGFSALEGVTEEVAERLVGEGFLSYDDLSVIEPDALMEMGGLTEEQVATIVEQAEVKAAEAEEAAMAERRRRKDQERIDAATAAEAAREAAERPPEAKAAPAADGAASEPASEPPSETASEPASETMGETAGETEQVHADSAAQGSGSADVQETEGTG